MFERLKNSNLAYVVALSACLNGVVGCGFFNGVWDKKYYKYQPTFEDRAVARTMILDKGVLVGDRYKEIAALIKKDVLPDESKTTSIKNSLSAMVNANNKKERKNEIVGKCIGDIKNFISDTPKIDENIAKVKNVLEGLVDAAIEQEEKEYVVNGLKFKVKDNCIYFTDLDISVPLTDIKVSDADVIGFSSDIQKVLRWRMDTARRVRMGSGSAQILAAAAGASLGLATGSVATAAALAAFSAVIPELQNIFQARDRSVAYEQGLEMIQDSESRYYQSRTANTSIGTVSTTELTTAGGKLLVEISACLKVVDKALLQTIPTIEDLQAAKGRLDEALGQIRVVPDNFGLKLNGTQTIQVLNSKAFTYSVDNAGVGVVKVKDFDYFKGTDRLEVEGEGVGDATVTVFSNIGRSTSFRVHVGENNKTQVQAGTDGTSTATTYLATKVGVTTATLNGTVTTNCSPTDVWFNYGTTDKFGSLAHHDHLTGTGTFSVNVPITGLSSGETYHFQVVGSNTASKNPVLGNVERFLTSKVTTGTATGLLENFAILIGEVITQGKTMERWFMYGTESGKCVTKVVVDDGKAVPILIEKLGSPNVVVSPIDKLTQGTVYYYELFAKIDANDPITGGEAHFTTKGTSVRTGAAKILDSKSVTLSGTVTTGSPPIKVWFDYGKEAGEYSNKINAKPETITTLVPTQVIADISSLTSGKYHFRVATEMVQGTDVSFEIP